MVVRVAMISRESMEMRSALFTSIDDGSTAKFAAWDTMCRIGTHEFG